MEEDMILFSAFSGCNFVLCLYQTKTNDIKLLMQKWNDPNKNQSLDSLLHDFGKGKGWQSGSGNTGAPTDDDFDDHVKKCIGLMMNAPVTALVDGLLKSSQCGF